MALPPSSPLAAPALSRTFTGAGMTTEIMDSEMVPSQLAPIVTRILRAANEIESDRPRVAYLCRDYAFSKAQNIDKYSNYRGVRQFKTALHQRLEKDEERSLRLRERSTDIKEVQSFYQKYYDDYIKNLAEVGSGDATARAQLQKHYQTAGVIYELLDYLQSKEAGRVEVEPEIAAKARDVTAKKQIYVPYNILPLDAAGSSQAIMQLPEVRAAVEALRNIRNLKFSSRVADSADIMDWLREKYGFQKDNVANQRESLILLISNAHVRRLKQNTDSRLDDGAIDEVKAKLFANYKSWCNFNGHKSCLHFRNENNTQQRKLLFMGLFVLIWGELSNLRAMAECMNYFFHNMGYELRQMLAGETNLITGEVVTPACGGDDESFLRKVVTPVYEVVRKEAAKNENGTAPHSAWRNYDDLNEHFWKKDCFRLGWPMRPDDDFFNTKSHKLNKTGFVEVRSFFHIFRSWDRHWILLILCLQAMIILAWEHKITSFSNLFNKNMINKYLSVFITAAILGFFQATLNIVFTFKALGSLDWSSKLRLLCKLVMAAFWVIVLPVVYSHTSSWGPVAFLTRIRSVLPDQLKGATMYNVVVMFYLLPNALSALFFLLPMLRRWIENCDWRIVRLILWWSQEPLFVGRGMHEGWATLFKYTAFWTILLAGKFAFSYFVVLAPLVRNTKAIRNIHKIDYTWHELFPHAQHNIGAIIAIWSPLILIYFMDTQIFYSITVSIVGAGIGTLMKLGEIRSLSMLRHTFSSLPSAFNNVLVPAERGRGRHSVSITTAPERDRKHAANFSQLWNEFISSFREEDLINDREKDLLLVPYSSDPKLSVMQWPPFLLARKIPVALQIAAEFKGKDVNELWRRIREDDYMRSGVEECYESFKVVLNAIVRNEPERRIVDSIINDIEKTLKDGSFLARYRLSSLPLFAAKFIQLMELLIKPDPEAKQVVILLLQDMYEIVSKDMVVGLQRDMSETQLNRQGNRQLFESIVYPPPASNAWFEQINRLHLLLTVKESAMDVPSNPEARRRLTFFANSLSMKIPRAPRVREMMAFSVLTPYYSEEILFTKEQLYKENEDGVSILYYLQKVYPDDWNNLLQRTGCNSESELWANEKHEMELREWASFRGQTLSRTVRGMMYYRKALELQTFLDIASDEELLEGYKVVANAGMESRRSQRSLSAQLQAIADMKFTYVLTCQIYGQQKRSGDPRATDILNLMVKYPALRVAYIDEVEEQVDGRNQKVYYSVLVKAGADGLDEEIYRIKLPGPPKIGEGKPENQNHAIIFTRGEALQTIDMNQDNYLEEAFKVRNLLQEFHMDHGVRPPTILGIREHIFTGSVSSLAWFMSNQETSFVTIVQRVLANPLTVRMHYGHPDFFDRLFHITRGGISKASKTINLSEDIYAGFNSTLRRGNITHHEYIQVGKGRDVGLNQIAMFEAKVANGNGEQTLSRDIYRLGHRFDFFRMLSAYYSTVGFYVSTLILSLSVYAFLYGRVYLALSGVEKSILKAAALNSDNSLKVVLSSQAVVQIGLLQGLPMVFQLATERGFTTALSDSFLMVLLQATTFFTFSNGTRLHYFGRTILHGGSKYRATGRGFVVGHERFAENYRHYSRSHFIKAFEILVLLVIYLLFGAASGNDYLLSMGFMWYMVFSWLFAPTIFNPSGFEWQKTVEDWDDWRKWMSNPGGIGIPASRSWDSWWEEEQASLKHTGILGRLTEIVLSARFFWIHYGLSYHLDVVHGQKSILVYGFSWLAVLVVLGAFKLISFGRQKLSARYQLVFRILKAAVLAGFLLVLMILFFVVGLTRKDLFVACLALYSTCWGLLQIGLACRPLVEAFGLWGSVRDLAKSFDYIMGFLLFAPIGLVSWFPFASEGQSRLLFNQAFSRGLQISRILAGKKHQ